VTISFEFRRHSIKDGPAKGMIGPQGWKLAREVGQRQLRGRAFSHFFASPLWRTHQTLAAFDEGAGDFHLRHTPTHAPYYVEPDEMPGLMDVWIACSRGAKTGLDMVDTAFHTNATLMVHVMAISSMRFHDWLSGFDDGARVLVVGHSPNMELLAYGLTGKPLPGLSECQGFRLDCRDGKYDLQSGTTDLDPGPIRKFLFADASP
jgi:phosphohistidine phosphatase SixA